VRVKRLVLNGEQQKNLPGAWQTGKIFCLENRGGKQKSYHKNSFSTFIYFLTPMIGRHLSDFLFSHNTVKEHKEGKNKNDRRKKELRGLRRNNCRAEW
jgi:hypothetical protein